MEKNRQKERKKKKNKKFQVDMLRETDRSFFKKSLLSFFFTVV